MVRSDPFLALLVEHRRWTRLCVWERWAHEELLSPVAGLDEVGRGCLAGPVVAAAVVLEADAFLPGLDDSKQMSPEAREGLAPLIRQQAVAWGIGAVEAGEIDECNILVASKRAMVLALAALGVEPRVLLLDAITLEQVELPQIPIVQGDAHCASIAAASVLAKVYRDHLMNDYAKLYPSYNFRANKGYATEEHRAALRSNGPSPLHRLSFGQVIPR